MSSETNRRRRGHRGVPVDSEPEVQVTIDTHEEEIPAAPTESLDPENVPLNHEAEKITEWIRKTHFRKNLFGGVNQADVWKKIGELNELYEAALRAERARYDALLEEYRKNAADPDRDGE